jgi:hypothetical protein
MPPFDARRPHAAGSPEALRLEETRTFPAPARGGGARRIHEEDEDIDLPPMDQDDDDEAPQDDEEDFDVAWADDADGDDEDPLDDATASDLEIGLDVGDDDGAVGVEADGELDVGALDEGVDFSEEADAGDSAAQDDADGFGDEHHDGVQDDDDGWDDGGAEGTSDAPEDDVDDADLPELDADDEGDEGDAALAEVLLAEADALPPWDASRWAVVEGAGAHVPCRAVAVEAGSVVAGGEVLLLVEEGARAAHRAGVTAKEAASIALTTDVLVVATSRGQLLSSRDFGATATPLGGWKPSHGDVELAATPGRVWIASEGALWSMTPLSEQISKVRARGVLRVRASGAVLVALTETSTGDGARSVSLERHRGDDEGWMSTPLGGEAARIATAAGARFAVAAGGLLVAFADAGSLSLSRDGGESFETTALERVLALAFAGDDLDGPLAVLLAPDAEGVSTVLKLDVDGAPSRVGELHGMVPSAGDSEGAAADMAWDASRDVIWIACSAGLLAMGRTPQH